MGSRPQPAMDRYGITPAASCSVPIMKSHADSVSFRERQSHIFLTNLKRNTRSQLPSHFPHPPPKLNSILKPTTSITHLPLVRRCPIITIFPPKARF